MYISLLIQSWQFIYFLTWRKQYYGYVLDVAWCNVFTLKHLNGRLLWCFYQLFGLSFWRHPSTTEHWWASDAMLNFSKSVLMKKQTDLHLGWPEGEYNFSKFSFLCELLTIPLNQFSSNSSSDHTVVPALEMFTSKWLATITTNKWHLLLWPQATVNRPPPAPWWSPYIGIDWASCGASRQAEVDVVKQTG